MNVAYEEKEKCAKALSQYYANFSEWKKTNNVKKCLAEEQRLLDSLFECGSRVVLRALEGERVPESRRNGLGLSLSCRVETEISEMFRRCLHKKVKSARDKALEVDVKDRQRWERKVDAIVRPRLAAFFCLAEAAFVKLCALEKDYRPSSHIGVVKAVLKRSLMCISDCFRYTRDTIRSEASVHLANFVLPDDPDTNDKLAILARCDVGIVGLGYISAMFYYCRALSAEKPEVISRDHRLALFVEHVLFEDKRPRAGSARKKSPSLRFSSSFVLLCWKSVVDDDVKATEEFYKKLSLWNDLAVILEVSDEERLSETHILQVVGTAMFVRTRASPSGHPTQALQPIAPVIDDVLCRLMLVLMAAAQSEIDTLLALLKGRKRNRLRSLQKKRHANGKFRGGKSAASPDTNGVVGLDLLHDVLVPELHMRVLGPLSFLAHFWSKTLVITPRCDLQKFKQVYDGLQGIFKSLDRVFDVSGISDASEQITSLVLVADKDVPFQLEDVFFIDYIPSRMIGMFRKLKLPSFAFRDMICQDNENPSIASAIEYQAEHQCFDNRCGGIQDSLAAFAKRLVVPAFPSAVNSNVAAGRKVSLSQIASMGLRRQRLSRLRDTISSHASGRIVRLPPPDDPAGDVQRKGGGIVGQTRLSGSKRLFEGRDAVEPSGGPAPTTVLCGPVISELPRYKRRCLAAARSQRSWASHPRVPKYMNFRNDSVHRASQSLAGACGSAVLETPARSVPSVSPIPLGQRVSPEGAVVDTPMIPKKVKRARPVLVSDSVASRLYGARLENGVLVDSGDAVRLAELKQCWKTYRNRTELATLAENPYLAEQLKDALDRCESASTSEYRVSDV